jgi:hypothetical protein
MDQSVMTFAGTAARGSAIGTAVEGMVTYLEDSNSLQLWDGASWTAAGGVTSGNAIINGAFEINQRGYASAGTLASGAYGFDRWKATAADTTLTFTSAPQGQLVTINSGKGIEQVVERANLPAGTYTLSWQGTATARIYNTGATPPSYAASPIIVTLDGLANVEVEFTASGGTRTCGFVQLEQGTVANAFRRNGNTLQGELAACQRYYQKSYNQGVAPQTNSQANGLEMKQSGNVANLGYLGSVVLPTVMRANPTVTIYSFALSTAAVVSSADGTDLAAGSGNAFLIGQRSFTAQNNSGGSITATQNGFVFHWIAEAEL